ncbi:MAG: hypothetical protein KDJ77_20055 [Rhodobiaceae bacterium]|nr:hypothetical protein [Rhodobiaceae bacterium]
MITRRPEAGLFATFGLVAALAMAGCATDQNAGGAEPQKTVRASAETAPADLQLICLNETATRLGVDSTTVFPSSSEATGTGSYRVTLKVGEGNAVCEVDGNGTVISVNSI